MLQSNEQQSKNCHVGSMESENDKIYRIHESAVPEFIEEHDIGLLNLSKNAEKPILSDKIRTKITKIGSKYFQNGQGPFLPTNNRTMSSNWFKRKLTSGEEVTRSWQVYSPSIKSAYCIYRLLYSRSEY